MQKDLTLQEKVGALASQLWYEAAAGQSCSAACALVSKGCAENLLADVTSPAKLDSMVSSTLPCEMPYVSSCQAHDT